RAKTAIPSLRKMLANTADSTLEAYLLATLVSLGDKSSDNLTAMEKALAESRPCYALLEAVAIIDSEALKLAFIIDKLSQLFEEAENQSNLIGIAAALGRMGEKAQSSAKKLHRLQAKAIKNSEPGAITYTLVLIRVDASSRHEVLRRFAKGCLR